MNLYLRLQRTKEDKNKLPSHLNNGTILFFNEPVLTKGDVSMQRVYDFLDKYILPWPVRYLSHRFVILLTISLLIPLVVYAANQVLVLLVNSYLNTMSVAVSSIVLLYATVSEIHQKQIAELQEKRAQEDHTHVVEMHTLLQASIAEQQKQIEELKQMLAAGQGNEYTPKKAANPIELRELHPRGTSRFDKHDTNERLASQLHKHQLTEEMRKNIARK
jgi:hypothetical protein